MAAFDPDVFGAPAAPAAGYDADVFNVKPIKAPANAPVSVQAGAAISNEVNSIPRQLGLTARYGLEAAGQGAQLISEPLRYVTDRLTGSVGKTKPAGVLASEFADYIGLPSPQGADERVIADGTRLGFGAMGMAGLANKAGGVASDVLQYAGKNAAPMFQGAQQKLMQMLGSNLPQQVSSATGAGLAGGASREAGGDWKAQTGSALVGGVLSGLAPSAIGGTVNGVKNAITSRLPGQQQLIQQRIDQTINVTLQNSGIDPSTITPAMRSAMREQVGRAMNMGDLNPQAVTRLADYARLNMTPTRSRLTLDPYDVTQEANASKLAAATGNRDALLPQIAQDNNRRLLTIVDDMGGARPADPYGQGSAVTGAVRSADAAMENQVRAAYQAFRDSTGRELPVPLGPLKEGYQATLKDFGETIPSAIRRQFEEVLSPKAPHAHGGSAGAAVNPARRLAFDGPAAVERPAPTLSIDQAEKLIKTINRNYNPADRAQARALDDLRGHLQKAIIGTTETGEGMEAATLANFARDAARQRFGWQDSSPAITRALQGANADTFVAQNVLSKAAGYDQVAALAQVVNQNPAARESVRTAIVQQLKQSMIGKGGTTETGNVTGRGLTAALSDIGDRKLALFFDPAEVETMKAMARTGSYEIFQPRGSAVNNSNTAAGVGSLLQGLSKYVKPVANRIPFGEMAISRPLDYVTAAALQRPAVNIPQGLLMQQQRQPIGQGLLLPAAAYGGLLAAP
jgi:hypothetical protein